ncbi:MAG: cell division protein FtsA [Chloroflexi bacterium]|nr:cell division protein FtsA [Chloroflexota bacterium]
MRKGTDALYAGIDVGTTKVQTLVARVGPYGELEMVARGLVASRGMRKGMVVSFHELGEAVRESVCQAERDLGRVLPPAYVGVTGQHISSFNTSSSLDRPEAALRPLSHREVKEAVRAASPSTKGNKKVLHLIPRAYSIDGLGGVRNPVGLCATQVDVEAHVITGDLPHLTNLARVLDSAGVAVKGLVLEPLASAEAVLTADEREMGAVMVDVGGGTSDIAIFQEGAIWHTAVVPVAGFHFTNDVSQALRLPFSLAEEAKLRYGSAEVVTTTATDYVELGADGAGQPRRIDRNRLCDVLHSRARDLVQQIVAKLKQAGLERVPAAGIVFTGGAARLPGLVELAADISMAPVRLGMPRESFHLPPELTSPACATCVGLLLWNFREPDVKTDGDLEGNGHIPLYRRVALRLGRAFSGVS